MVEEEKKEAENCHNLTSKSVQSLANWANNGLKFNTTNEKVQFEKDCQSTRRCTNETRQVYTDFPRWLTELFEVLCPLQRFFMNEFEKCITTMISSTKDCLKRIITVDFVRKPVEQRCLFIKQNEACTLNEVTKQCGDVDAMKMKKFLLDEKRRLECDLLPTFL